MRRIHDPFWSLDQVVAWARSRSLAAVEAAEREAGRRLEIRISVEAAKAKSEGRDIDAELWGQCGKTRPEVAQLSPDQRDEPESFHVEPYIALLCRRNELSLIGTPEGELHSRPMTDENWSSLVIDEARTNGKRGVWTGGSTKRDGPGEWKNVRFRKSEVLGLFRPAPKKLPTKAAGKKACEDWLIAERREGRQKMTKEKYKAVAIERFKVGPDQFRTAWDGAAKREPSVGWGRPGAPKNHPF